MFCAGAIVCIPVPGTAVVATPGRQHGGETLILRPNLFHTLLLLVGIFDILSYLVFAFIFWYPACLVAT